MYVYVYSIQYVCNDTLSGILKTLENLLEAVRPEPTFYLVKKKKKKNKTKDKKQNSQINFWNDYLTSTMWFVDFCVHSVSHFYIK